MIAVLQGIEVRLVDRLYAGMMILLLIVMAVRIGHACYRLIKHEPPPSLKPDR